MKLNRIVKWGMGVLLLPALLWAQDYEFRQELDSVQVEINGAVQDVQGQYDAQNEALTLQDIALRPVDRLTLTVSVKAGSLLAKGDRRLATCRKLLWAFQLHTEVKRDIDLALPEILRDSGRLSPFGNALTDAQWAALLDVVSLYSPGR